MPLRELAVRFDLGELSKAPTSFDLARLDNLASAHLRALDGNELPRRALPYLEQAGLVAGEGAVDKQWRAAIMEVARGGVTHLSELPERVEFFCGNRSSPARCGSN